MEISFHRFFSPYFLRSMCDERFPTSPCSRKFALMKSLSLHLCTLLFSALALSACTEDKTEDAATTPAAVQEGSAQPQQTSTPTTAPSATTSERDGWQRPHELINMIGPNIKGMVIADLFADDGYFTFKLIEAGANVIAIENDPAKVAKLEERKRELGLGDDRLRIRAVPVGDPGLGQGEAEAALITHRYNTIQNKASYIKRLRQGLLAPRPLFIIEWQYRETPIGPPMSQRMPTEDLMDEVGELGYSDIGAHSAKMPYQVVFLATDYMEMDDAEYKKMMEGVEVVPQ